MSAVLVLSYLNAYGFTPMGKIADACDLSVSSVEKALAKLKALKLLPKNSPQKIEHDHDQFMDLTKGTEQVSTGLAVEDCGGVDHQADADPIREKLLAFDVLPWCVDTIMVKLHQAELRREDVLRQLDYHAFRLAKGFKFKAHPARYVFSAILKGYAPPENFHTQSHKAREGVVEAVKVPAPYQRPQEATEAPVAPEETIRTMLRSPIVSVRRMAIKLAADWGVDIPELQAVVAV